MSVAYLGIATRGIATTMVIRLAVVCGLLTGTYTATGQTGAMAAPRKVAGMVVNAVTGAGIPKALVQAPTGSGQASVLTGADGRFEMGELPAGEVLLTAGKPGYFNEQELGQASEPTRAIHAGESASDIRLRLFPEGVIEGRVWDETEEPVEGAAVHLYVSQLRAGRRRWVPADGGTTDELGGYRLAGLRPGEYLLGVTAGGSRGRGAGQDFDLVFGTRFHAGAATPEQATPIAVLAGQHAHADFQLKRERGYLVIGAVGNLPAGSTAMVSLIPAGTVKMDYVVAGAQTKANGQFRLGPVAAGEYLLRAQAEGAQGALRQQIPLTVGHDGVTEVGLALEGQYEIPVQVTVVRTKSTTPLPPPDNGAVASYIGGAPGSGAMAGSAQGRRAGQAALLGGISFDSEDGSLPGQMVQLPEQGEPLVVKGLYPGTYRMTAGQSGTFYIESARSGDADLLEAPLAIHSGVAPAPLQIVLRDDGADARFDCGESGGKQGCAILLTAAQGPPRLINVYGGGSRSTGGLAPGTYRAYAFDTVAGLEYANPEALREYYGKGQGITLEANGRKTITLEVIHLDARGAP